jgi:hypothetical protein
MHKAQPVCLMLLWPMPDYVHGTLFYLKIETFFLSASFLRKKLFFAKKTKSITSDLLSLVTP